MMSIYDPPSEEISDVCPGAATFAGYTVTRNWSNFAGKCVGHIPICDGSKQPPACRPCNPFDSGVGCSGATPLCAADGPRAGQCVACTAADASACAGATPACDQATNACVGCLADADCGDPGALVCDPATKSCRGCAATGECATGVCNTTPDAQEGQCVACVADADCGAEEVCREHACGPEPRDRDAESGCALRPERGGAGEGSAALLAALLSLAGARRRERARPRRRSRRSAAP